MREEGKDKTKAIEKSITKVYTSGGNVFQIRLIIILPSGKVVLYYIIPIKISPNTTRVLPYRVGIPDHHHHSRHPKQIITKIEIAHST